MAQWVLKINGNVVPCHTLHDFHVREIHSPTEIKKRDTFDALIQRRWDTSITPPNVFMTKDIDKWEEYHDEDEPPRLIPEVEDDH